MSGFCATSPALLPVPRPAATFTGTPGALTARLVDSTATGLVNGGPANVSTSGGVTPFSAASVVLSTSVTAAINPQA